MDDDHHLWPIMRPLPPARDLQGRYDAARKNLAAAEAKYPGQKCYLRDPRVPEHNDGGQFPAVTMDELRTILSIPMIEITLDYHYRVLRG